MLSRTLRRGASPWLRSHVPRGRISSLPSHWLSLGRPKSSTNISATSHSSTVPMHLSMSFSTVSSRIVPRTGAHDPRSAGSSYAPLTATSTHDSSSSSSSSGRQSATAALSYTSSSRPRQSAPDSTTFISSHVVLPREDLVEYLVRKNLVIKESPDKILVMDCPLCPKPTHGKPDNQWKFAVFNNGGYNCVRCGCTGSWYDLKRRLGDLPGVMTQGDFGGFPSGQPYASFTQQSGSSSARAASNGSTDAGGTAPETLNQDEVVSYVEALDAHPDVMAYLTGNKPGQRGLSPDVLRLYKVGVKMQKFPVTNANGGSGSSIAWEEHKCVVFPWTRHASLAEGASAKCPNVYFDRLKLRSTRDKSQQRITPKGGPWGFFGWHTVPPDAEEVIITEGEYDALAVRMATGRPCISLPNGAHSFPVPLIPCLERFKRIILWMDDDAAGHEGAEVIVRKLGLQRCFVVTPPAAKDGDKGSKAPKDANDALRQGYNLEQIIASAAPCMHKQVASFASFRHEVKRMFTDPNAHKGVVLAGMPQLQSLMKGHRRGELTIFTGSTGVGKTTILSQLSLEVATQGVPTLWGSFEIRNPRLARTMMMQHAASLGILLSPDRPEHFDLVADHFQNLPFHFLRFYGSSPVAEVIDAMDYAVYVHDVQHIILDNLQFMLSGQSKGNGDKFDIQDRAIESFRQFASQRNVHVSLVIHPRKEADNSSLGLSSVFGSAKATQEADNVLIIQQGLPRALLKPLGIAEAKAAKTGRQDLAANGGFDDPLTGEVINTFFRTLELRKNRWDGDLGAVPLRFDKASNRLFELSKEDIQLGLQSFIEKQKKAKQLELINAMNQSHEASAKRGPVTSSFSSSSSSSSFDSAPRRSGFGDNVPGFAPSGSGDAGVLTAPLFSPSSQQQQQQQQQQPQQQLSQRMKPPSLHQPSLDIIVD